MAAYSDMDEDIEGINIKEAERQYLDSRLFGTENPLPPIMPKAPTHIPKLDPNYLRILKFTTDHPRPKEYKQWTLEQITQLFTNDAVLLNTILLLIESYEELLRSTNMPTKQTILSSKINTLHATMQAKWEKIADKRKTKTALKKGGKRTHKRKKRNTKRKGTRK